MSLQTDSESGLVPALKQKAAKAGRRVRQELERAQDAAQPLARTATRQAKIAGQKAVDGVRQKPVTTAVAVAGIGAGLFLLLNSRARHAVVDAGASLWNTIRKYRK
jgi:ElaB/YqjD/DUF883 family membrane-anchored ribosome-binding protein